MIPINKIVSSFESSNQQQAQILLEKMDANSDTAIDVYEFTSVVDPDRNGVSTRLESQTFIMGHPVSFVPQWENPSLNREFLIWARYDPIFRGLVDFLQRDQFFGDLSITLDMTTELFTSTSSKRKRTKDEIMSDPTSAWFQYSYGNSGNRVNRDTLPQLLSELQEGYGLEDEEMIGAITDNEEYMYEMEQWLANNKKGNYPEEPVNRDLATDNNGNVIWTLDPNTEVYDHISILHNVYGISFDDLYSALDVNVK